MTREHAEKERRKRQERNEKRGREERQENKGRRGIALVSFVSSAFRSFLLAHQSFTLCIITVYMLFVVLRKAPCSYVRKYDNRE